MFVIMPLLAIILVRSLSSREVHHVILPIVLYAAATIAIAQTRTPQLSCLCPIPMYIPKQGCQLLNYPNMDNEGTFTLQCPLLQSLCLDGLGSAVSMSLDCARLEKLTLLSLGMNQSCILGSSPIPQLAVFSCPYYNMSELIVPTPKSIHLSDTVVSAIIMMSLLMYHML